MIVAEYESFDLWHICITAMEAAREMDGSEAPKEPKQAFYLNLINRADLLRPQKTMEEGQIYKRQELEILLPCRAQLLNLLLQNGP